MRTIRPLRNGVVRDLQAALDFLGSRPGVDAGRLGAIGFCMGGSYALQLACVAGDLKAASLFYGPKLQAICAASPETSAFC